MRTAYRGRAAAYEKRSEYAKALADHTMAVTYYAIEIEITNELDAPDRGKLMAEAAEEYLARSRCLAALGRTQAALTDRDRAAKLRAEANPEANSGDTVAADRVRIINAWNGPVSLEVDGTTYRIETGTRKDIPMSAASVTCQVRTGPYLQSATFRAGRSYTIR
jgi:hypothetical protein